MCLVYSIYSSLDFSCFNVIVMFVMKIDNNIPLPQGNREKFPFNNMEVGDSFIASNDPSEFSEVIQVIKERNKAGDVRLFFWHIVDEPIESMRVWRVSLDEYFERCAPNDKKLIDSLFDMIKARGGETTHSNLIRSELLKREGSSSERMRAIEKYKFLFTFTKSKKSGGGRVIKIA